MKEESARTPRHRFDGTQLARTTETPLLVTRIERAAEHPDDGRQHLFQRMLFATVFSDNAEGAFESFSDLRHVTRETTLVHVETLQDPEPEGGTDPEGRLAELAS